MWILHFLPDAFIVWFCNILLLAGVAVTVAGFFIKSIPLLNQYRVPAQILGIALLTLGVYFRGGVAVETEWRERVAAVEAKLKAAEEISQKENTRIETRVIQKTEYITRRGQDIVQYVDRVVARYDATCAVPGEFIQAHNRAAEAPPK
jgi:hypothetical protein